jgi:hypothetical protein
MKECFRLPDTTGVIFNSAGTAPAPARRTPGAGGVEYNTRCVQKPVGPVTLTAMWPAALTLRPRRPRSARARPDRILHASPFTPLLLCLIRRAGKREKATATARVARHNRGLGTPPAQHKSDARVC